LAVELVWISVIRGLVLLGVSMVVYADESYDFDNRKLTHL